MTVTESRFIGGSGQLDLKEDEISIRSPCLSSATLVASKTAGRPAIAPLASLVFFFVSHSTLLKGSSSALVRPAVRRKLLLSAGDTYDLRLASSVPTDDLLLGTSKQKKIIKRCEVRSANPIFSTLSACTFLSRYCTV